MFLFKVETSLIFDIKLIRLIPKFLESYYYYHYYYYWFEGKGEIGNYLNYMYYFRNIKKRRARNDMRSQSDIKEKQMLEYMCVSKKKLINKLINK